MARARTAQRNRQRKKARRRSKRRAAAAATLRSMGQLLVVLVGGSIAGGVLVLAAFPDAIAPVPPTACVAAAGAVAMVTFWSARRLGPVS